jgi:type III secretion system YscQ/HrcQ family protein
MIEPYPIREVSAHDVARRNAVVGTRRAIRVSVHQTPLELRFHDNHAATISELLVQLSIGGAGFIVGLADWNRLPGITEFLDGGLVSSIPSDLLPAVLEAIFEQELDRLGTLASARAEVKTTHSSVADLESLSRIGISLIPDDEQPLHGFIAGDDAAMKLLQDLIDRAPAEAAHPFGELPLVAGVQIGETRLAIEELQRLKIHDVLLLDTSTFVDNREGLIRFSPTYAWRVGIADNQSTCIELLNTPEAENVHEDEISVTIVVEMGHVRCSVDELSGLQPDSILTIADGEMISLRCGGRPFARGELVLIADRPGVRLLSRPLSCDHDPPESHETHEPEPVAYV